MTINKLSKNENYNNKTFKDIKHLDENGVEFWYARELMPILQYSNWQNFEKIIDKAEISCKNSDVNVLNHFIDISKMVPIGSGAKRKQQKYKLTRYACYLIAQKGLCNGETDDDITKRKGLRYREDILDNMGSTELITNL